MTSTNYSTNFSNNFQIQCTDLYGNDYDDEIELKKYTWYYDKSRLDKIGINHDGTKLMHDSMIYTLKKFRKIEKKIEGLDTMQLVYKLDDRNGNSGQYQQYFTDLIFNERSNYIVYKYVEHDGKLTFTHIVFNGKQFNGVFNF